MPLTKPSKSFSLVSLLTGLLQAITRSPCSSWGTPTQKSFSNFSGKPHTYGHIYKFFLRAWWPLKDSNLMLTQRDGANVSSALVNMQQIYPEAIDREECRHTWRLSIGDLLINELPSIIILFDFICSFSSRSLYPGLRLWRDGYSEETSQRISIHLPSGNLDDLSGTLTVFVRVLISRLLQAHISESKTFLMLNMVGIVFNGSASLDFYFHHVVNLGRAVEALQFINYPAATLSVEDEYPDLEAIGVVSVLANGVEHPIVTGGDLFGFLEPLTELPATPIKVGFSGDKGIAKPFQLRISLDNTAVGVCRNILYHVMFTLFYVEHKYGKLASKAVEINPSGKSAMLVISAYGPKNHVYELFRPLRRLLYILLAHMNVSNESSIMVGKLGPKDNFVIDKTIHWGDDVSGIRSQQLIYDVYPKGPIVSSEAPPQVLEVKRRNQGNGKGKKKAQRKQKAQPSPPKRQQPTAVRKPAPSPAVESVPNTPLPETSKETITVPVTPKPKPTSPWESSPWARTPITTFAVPEVKYERPLSTPEDKPTPVEKMTRHQKKLAKGLSRRNKSTQEIQLSPTATTEQILPSAVVPVDSNISGPVASSGVVKPSSKKPERLPKHLVLPQFDANGVSWKVALPYGSIEKFESSESEIVTYFDQLFKSLPTGFFDKNSFSVMRNRLTRGKLVELITVPIEKQAHMYEFIDIFIKTSLKNIEVEKFAIHDAFVVLYVSGLMSYTVRSRLAHQVRKIFRLPSNEFERLRDLTENKPRKHPQVTMSTALIPSKQLKASPPFMYCDKTWEFFYFVDNSWNVFKYKIFLKGTIPDHPYKYLDTFLAALPSDYFAKGHGFEAKLADYNPLSQMFITSASNVQVKQAKRLLRPHQVMVVRPHFGTKSEVYQAFVRIFAECAVNNLPVFKFKVGDLANPADAFIEIHLCQGARPLKAARIRLAVRALGLKIE